jgi:hypothetical protein
MRQYELGEASDLQPLRAAEGGAGKVFGAAAGATAQARVE